jgi:hypothetical protein
MSDTKAFRDRVEAYFKARPMVWLDSFSLELVGGRCAWRTRVSECCVSGMDIRNRQRRVTAHDGLRWTVSEYCYFPAVSAPPQDETRGHDLNEAQAGSLF